jgi:tetratricopeptide (TPR) repeat protein
LPQEATTLLGELWKEPTNTRPTDAAGAHSHDRLLCLLQTWADTVKRRQFLLAVGRAATAAAAVPLLDTAGLTEADRLGQAIVSPVRVDTAIIGHIAQVLRHAERQYETLGPQATIQTVLDQRHLARHLLDGCPADLRPQLLSVYADLCRVTGVFIFDLGQYQASMPHFEEARTAAHEASNTELGALTLCHMAYSAIWQGRPRLAVDHAVAAASWAHRTPDRALQANTSDMTARAFAAVGDYDAAMGELDRAETALSRRDDSPSLSYWYDEAFLHSIRGQCLLQLKRPAEALAILEPSVAALDPATSVRNLAMTKVDLGAAYLQQGEVEQAAHMLGRAAQLAVRNRSVRLAIKLRETRSLLDPWKDSPAVQDLDEQLDVLQIMPADTRT